MPRGGARCGAGRPAERDRIESFDRIRVSDALRRVGYAQLKSWNVGKGEPAVSLGHAHLGSVQRIALTSTPCHYGGRRWWFVCPGCERPVGVLVLRWQRYACRHCVDVSYRSQALDVITRSWRRQRRLERRLGSDPLVKPIGMHWTTYQRIRTEIRVLNARRNQIWVTQMLAAYPQLALIVRDRQPARRF